MIFNPTPYIFDYGIGDDYFQSATITTMNGGHAVFILDTEYQEDNAADNPHYNSYTGSSQNNAWNALRKKQVIPHIMWVGYWLSSETEQWLENSITIQARIDGLYDQTIMNESCECDCIDDSDGDNICDEFDNCIDTYNPDQQDTDGDGLGDDCDQTPGFIEESLQNRSLIKVVDILGRDAYQQDFYIEIYDDGSIEKKYIIE